MLSFVLAFVQYILSIFDLFSLCKKSVGQWERAMGLISEALADGVRPDIITFNTAVTLPLHLMTASLA